MKELLKVEAKPKYRYWFFSFNDNLSLTEEDIEKKKRQAPKGTKLYKNKILGLRGKATGLVFNIQDKDIITEEEARQMKFVRFSIGCDTSYSKLTHDKLTFEFIGITEDKRCVLLEEETHNNKDREIPFAPSDVILKLVAFAEKCKVKWGFALHIFIDNADAGTIAEANKYKRESGCIYKFVGAWKKTTNLTRVQLQQSWYNTNDFLIVDTCKAYIDESNTYSFTEDGELEDANDHSIQGCQYAWLPFKKMIGNWELLKTLIKDADNDN